MDKKEKLEKLNSVVKTLKTEFVGLDSIIDRIKEYITPWYLTQELLTRPVVISLWGMTGTGKTSLVNRFIELLELKKVLNYNCGVVPKDRMNYSFDDSLEEFISNDDDDNMNSSSDLSRNMVFVLDEFQQSRTVNADGTELERPTQQSIWSLLDSGIIRIDRSRNYVFGKVVNYSEDLIAFIKKVPEAVNYKANNFYFTEENEIISILSSLGYMWWDRKLPILDGVRSSTHTRFCSSVLPEVNKKKNTEDDEEDYKKPLKVIPDDTLIRFLSMPNFCNKEGAGILESLSKAKTLGEVSNILVELINDYYKTSVIDCSNSLVFVIGNLDEAFYVSKDLTPDMDADIFYDTTSKITVNDIKKSLLNRFRPEQVSRFGNNIIKYPVLKSEFFRSIIKNEIGKVTKSFKEHYGIDIEVDSSLYELIYCEGVYPTQGTRPVFSTINSIYSPILSEIYALLDDSKAKVTIKVLDAESGYNKKSKTIRVMKGDETLFDKEIELVLGSLRLPENCKNRYAKAVHEIGHAIMYAYCTGNAPADIMAVGSGEGGWCVTKDLKLSSKPEIKNSIMIAYGGILAEKLIYGDENILMGSGSDLGSIWSTMSDVAYNFGYFNTYKFTNPNSPSTVPSGIYDNWKTGDLQELIMIELRHLSNETSDVLRDNIDLLRKAALKLGECGRIDDKVFLEFVKKYGNTLNEKSMEEAKEKFSSDFYKDFLLHEDYVALLDSVKL